jgi:uncharacterized membrane protein YhiD involved in acid resistance
MNFLNQTGISFEQFDLLDLLLRMGAAFALSSFAGGISFWGDRKRRMTESMVFGGISLSLIVTMILLVLSANVFYALGLFAALSIIRFRTPVKDVKDTVHLFLSIGIGIACGAGMIKIAIFCTLFILSFQQIYRFFSQPKCNLFLLKIVLDKMKSSKDLETYFKENGIFFETIKIQMVSKDVFEYLFHLSIKPSMDIKKIVENLNELDSITMLEVIPCMTIDLQ